MTNDTYGHAVGDLTLRVAVGRMQGALRRYDILGRFGGDEFVALLPGCDATSARDLAERLRAAVAAEPVPSDRGPISTTVSVGVAALSDVAERQLAEKGPDALLEAADRALYVAKAEGRNRTALSPSRRKPVRRHDANGASERKGSHAREHARFAS